MLLEFILIGLIILFLNADSEEEELDMITEEIERHSTTIHYIAEDKELVFPHHTDKGKAVFKRITVSDFAVALLFATEMQQWKNLICD